jgi:hypothetical protein
MIDDWDKFSFGRRRRIRASLNLIVMRQLYPLTKSETHPSWMRKESPDFSEI